jgi:PBSX family phage terminase large subunit
MSRHHNIQLLPHQWEAFNSEHKQILLLGGIGAGKSATGAHWIIKKCIESPGSQLAVMANTYTQLINASVKALIQVLDETNIPYKKVLSGSKKHIQVGNTTILLYSLENYEAIRGIELYACWIDEISWTSLEALNVVRGRMRGKGVGETQMLLTTSPLGFNWLYKEFSVNKRDSMHVIHSRTKDNIFLPEGYYEDLLEQYGGEDSPLARQELFGEFINLTSGSIYNQFKRGVNVIDCKEIDRRHPVYVGCDYNIGNMSAVYMQWINGIFYVRREVHLSQNSAGTHELAVKIKDDLKGYNVIVVPDSTGNARKTSSITTDHMIMRDQGLNVAATRNPLIIDRQNTVNIAFLKRQLMVDTSCNTTIEEIETLTNRDKEGLVSHKSVAIGYVLWYLAPLQPKVKPSSSKSFY